VSSNVEFPSTEKLIEKWSSTINSSNFINRSLENNTIKPLHELFHLLMYSASLVKSGYTDATAPLVDEKINFLIRGSFALGLEFRERNRDTGELFSFEQIPSIIREKLEILALPLRELANEFLVVSHSGDRIIYLPENQIEAQSETNKGITNAVNRCFIYATQYKMPAKQKIVSESVSEIRHNKNNISKTIIWIVSIMMGGTCAFLGFANRQIYENGYMSSNENIIISVITLLFWTAVPATILFGVRWAS